MRAATRPAIKAFRRQEAHGSRFGGFSVDGRSGRGVYVIAAGAYFVAAGADFLVAGADLVAPPDFFADGAALDVLVGTGGGPSRLNVMLTIFTGVRGLSLASRGTRAILLTRSCPSTTWPKMV
jgi:hypothetical protein